MIGIISCVQAAQKESKCKQFKDNCQLLKQQTTNETYNTMGTAVRNLRVAVNCSPSSICSQCVNWRPVSFSIENHGAPLIMCKKYKWAYI